MLPVTMRAALMMAMAAGMALALPAQADTVPPFKGNDTGGIAAYAQFTPQQIRDLSFAHCAGYGKVAKLTAVQAHYGGYVSFACRWRPTLAHRDRTVVRALY